MALYTPYKYPLAGSGMPKPEPPENPWANPRPGSVMGGVNPSAPPPPIPGFSPTLGAPLVQGARALRSGLGLANPSLTPKPSPVDPNLDTTALGSKIAGAASALVKPVNKVDPTDFTTFTKPYDYPGMEQFYKGAWRSIPNFAADVADYGAKRNTLGMVDPKFGDLVREGWQQTPLASQGTSSDAIGEAVGPLVAGAIPKVPAAVKGVYDWKPTTVSPAQFHTRTGVEGRPANLQGVPFQVQRYPLGQGMVDYHAYTTPKPSWENLYPQPEHMGSALMAKLGPSYQSQFTSTTPKWRTVRNSMWGPDQGSLGVAGHIYDEAERWHAVTPDINLHPEGQAYWIARDKANGTNKFGEMVRSRFDQVHRDHMDGMDPNAVANRLEDISEAYQHPSAIPIVRAEEERIRNLIGGEHAPEPATGETPTSDPTIGVIPRRPYYGAVAPVPPTPPGTVQRRPATARFTDEPPQDVPKGDTIEGEFTPVPDDGTTPARFETKTPTPEDFNQSQFIEDPHIDKLTGKPFTKEDYEGLRKLEDEAGGPLNISQQWIDDVQKYGVKKANENLNLFGEQPPAETPLQLPKVDKSTPTGADWDTLQKLIAEAKGFVGHQGAPLPFNYRPAVDPSRPLFPPQSYNPNPDLMPWGLHPNDDIRAHVADRIYNRMIGEQTLQPWQEGWGTQNPELGQQIELSDFIKAGNNLKTEGVLPTKYQTDPKYAALREHFRGQGHDIPHEPNEPLHGWPSPEFPADHPFVGMPEPTWLTNPRLGDKFQDYMKSYEDKFQRQLNEAPHPPVTPADIPRSYSEMMDDNNLHPMVKEARDYVMAQHEATAQQRHFMFDTLMMRLDAMTRAPVHWSGQRPFHTPLGSGWEPQVTHVPAKPNPNLDHIVIPPEVNMAKAKAEGYTRDAVKRMIHDYTFNYEWGNPEFMALRRDLLGLGFKDYVLKAEYNRLIQGLQNPGAPE